MCEYYTGCEIAFFSSCVKFTNRANWNSPGGKQNPTWNEDD